MTLFECFSRLQLLSFFFLMCQGKFFSPTIFKSILPEQNGGKKGKQKEKNQELYLGSRLRK